MKLNNKCIRIFPLLLVDALIIWISFFCAIVFRLGGFQSDDFPSFFQHFLVLSGFFVLIMLAVFAVGRVYHTLWRFANLHDLLRIAFLGLFGSMLCFWFCEALTWLSLVDGGQSGSYLPRTVFFIAPFLICTLVILSRLLIRSLYILLNKKQKDSQIGGRAMIIGAGSAGAILIENIETDTFMKDVKVLCFVDDDPAKQGMAIHGVRVCGTRKDIVRLAKEKNLDMIIFAIPTCSAAEKSTILHICQKTNCKLKALPPIYQLIDSKTVTAHDIRDVEIGDLLGREPIRVDLERVADYVRNQVVLVTGGGGSIGSELCRQIASHDPKQLIIFDIYENNAYDIQNELKRKYPSLNLKVLIGSVRDSKRLDQLFRKYRPDIIYHAAAHKHVPLMEDSPNEAIKNNVIGTLKMARTADRYGVKRFVMISTDKAVNPTNIMGASKRICEMIVQSYNARSKTDFVAVRFGNVLGSNGSAIPLFKRQIAAGGPVTVTDPDIIRFFMTIPEAVSLVLQAGAYAKGGEIFVLDMGKPVRILDMAENMIRLCGYEPYVDIDIQFIGLRPGEKKYEELLMDEEGLEKTENNLIYIGKPIEFDETQFWQQIESLESVMYDDNADLRTLVKQIVPTYQIPKSENC